MIESRALQPTTRGAAQGNLAALLPAVAAEVGERTALELDGDRAVSYRVLDAASARVAALLRRRGVEPGDRVGIMLPSVPEFAIVYYGVLRAGGVVVPLSARLPSPELSFYLDDAGARLLFAWHAFAEPAEAGARGASADCLFVTPPEFRRMLATVVPDPELCPRADGDTAAILYSPGAADRSRGAELTHRNLRRNADAVRLLHGLGDEDVVLAPVPLFRCFGQTCALTATLGAGARLSLMTSFEPALALRRIAHDGVTSFQGVPRMFAALLAQRDGRLANGSTLRVCRSRGRMDPELRRRFEKRFGCAVLEGYGLSATSPLAASTRMGSPRKPGSAGTRLDGVEILVVDADGREVPTGEVGEIVVRGHNVMKGYWRDADATAARIDAAGFLHTGDRGSLDADGDLFVAK
ncbi:MAG: long-chain-fatty-acid--CoA ligase [Solirubrobacterales bacterium]|nr:long-chain-fatty-acid--CoA ligase [Solirubrobacterales bacterium]